MFLESLESRSLLATITAGAGPGGFESFATASSLAFWVDAGDIDGNGAPDALANGASIATWVDKSGFGRNLTSTGTVSYTLASPVGNNQPATRYSGSRMQSAFDFDALGSDYSVFAVSRYTGGADQRVVSSVNHNWLFGHWSGGDQRWYAEGWIQQSGTASQAFNIYTGIIGPTVPNADFWKNGTQLNDNSGGYNAGNYKPGRLEIGSYSNGAEASNAEVSELLIINRKVNEAERLAILNALSAKYNLPIGAQDAYLGDDPGNGDFDSNVFGVGRLDASNQLLSAGQAGFGIEATSIADDGDFIGAGHKVAVNAFTAAGVPASVSRRFTRTWAVQVNDANDNLGATLAFDYSDAGLSIGTATTFKLLYSPTGATWTDVGATAIVSGDQIKFNLSASQLTSGLYTLGDASAPVVTATAGATSYTIGAAAVAVDPTLTVTTGASPTITNATVAINGFVNGNADVLALPAPVGAITGSYNATTGILTLSGNDTAANYQAALRSVTFAKATYQGTPSRALTFTATDLGGFSGSGIRNIVINATAASTPIIWDGNSDGDGDGVNWTNPQNWAGDITPDSNDVAVFTNLDTGIVAVPTNVFVGSISFTSSGVYSIDSTGGNISLTIGAVTQSGTSSNTITADMAMVAPATSVNFDVTSGTTLTDSGSISGTGNLDKNGAGTLVLGGTNTYTGTTNINNGVLRALGNVPALPINLSNTSGGLNIADAAHIVASSFYSPDGRSPFRVSDWSGMSGTFPNGAAGNSPGNTMWLSNSTTGPGTWIAWDLGSSYNIGSSHIWNYNEVNGTFVGRGVKNFDLQIATTTPPEFGGVGTWTTVQAGVDWSNTALYQGTNLATYTGFDYTWSVPFNTRYVRFNNTQNYGTSDAYTGLSEVIFRTAGAVSRNPIPDSSLVTIANIGTLDIAGTTETIGALAGAGTVTSSVAGTPNIIVGGGNASGSFSGVIQNGSGTMTLTKVGTGLQTLSGVNTYTGATNIENGTLQIAGGADRLPTTTAVTLGAAATGGVLDLNGQNQTVAGLSTAGAGVSRVVNSGGGTPNLTVNLATGTSTFGGILGNAAQNGFNLVKNGAGTLLLSSANTFTGSTTINGGVLTIGADAALGTAPGAFVANQIAIANNATLRTTAGFTLNANRGITLGAGGGTLDIAGGVTYAGSFAGGTSLTKVGAGDLILTNNAVLSVPGTTNINAGRIFFTSQNAIGAGVININNGGTLDYLSGGALSLTNTVNIASGGNIATRPNTLTVPNAVLPTTGTLIINQDDQNTNMVVLPQNIALTGALTIQVGGGGGNGGTAQLTGVISGAGVVTKTQNGTLWLANGGNTFSGNLNVNAGTVRATANGALGTVAGGTNVAAGATLQFDGGVTYSTAEPVTLSGNGLGGTISGLSGTNTFNGPVSIVSAPVPTTGFFSGGDVGEGLDLDGTFTYAVNARGPGGLPVRNANFTDQAGAPGVVITAQNEILNWQNPAFGATANDDNLEIVMQSIRWSGNPVTVDVALNSLTVGQSYKLQLLFYEPGNTGRGFDVFFDGNQILNDYTAGYAPANNGSVITYEFIATATSHTIVLNGANTPFGDKNPILQGLTLEQNTGFTGAAGTANVNAVAGNLILGGVVSGAQGSINKTGAGTVTFAGANTYGGLTTVNGGALAAANNAALGGTTNGTTVYPGSTLALANGVTITGEPIIASGTGAAGSAGAITNALGNNVLASPVTAVGAELQIGSLAGTLSVSGNINMTTATLSFNGAGNVDVSGVISQGAALPLNGVMRELEIWLDATDINANGTATANNAVVSNWKDKSGKNHNFDSMLGDPNYVLTSTNGMPAVNFDGDDAIRTNLSNNNPRAFIDGNGEFTLLSVARYSGADRERVIAATSGHNWLFGFHGGSTNRGGHYDGWGSLDPAPVGNVSDTNWHLHANQMNVFSDVTNPAGDWWRDGVLLTNDGRGTGDAFANNVPDGLSLGAWNGLAESSTADVSELLMFNRAISDGELSLLQTYLNTKYSLGFAIPTTTVPVVNKLGTGTVTLTGNNTYTAVTTVNGGTLVAASTNALGTVAGGTSVASGATLGLAGNITLANEAITLSGSGAATMLGALTNISGNNTVPAGASVAATDGASSFAISSLAGLLTIASPVNLKFARLTTDGPGNITINGSIGSVLPTSPALATINNYPTGTYSVTAAGQTFPVYVNNDGTNSWMLIGRGREGWEFDTNGQGTSAQVSTNVGVAAGFAPAALSDVVVNDLLAQSGINNTGAAFRIRRATDTTGATAFQEYRWTNFSTPSFTFDFDDANAGAGVGVTAQVFASSLSAAAGPAVGNTRDFQLIGNDGSRIFTWPWGSHNNQRGFSYGQSITSGSNAATSFLWENANEDHAIPYAEIYIRGTTQVTQDNTITKLGTGTTTFGGANTFNSPININAGMLVAANNTALGTVGQGTTVATGAALGFAGNITVASEPVTVNAVNGNTQDSIVNVSGTNTFSGPITFSVLTNAASTNIGAFTGGDVGEGLDLQGTFLYAVNMGGPAVGPVQDASFTSSESGGTPGLTFTAPNIIPNWHAPNYGNTANDNNLETVLQSIRYNGGTTSVDLTGLTVGNIYKLQLLYAESCCMRGFDVSVEGTMVAPAFAPFTTQGGINNTTQGAQITRVFQAGDTILNIAMVAPGAFADPNPIINGLTVENLGPVRSDLNIRSDAGSLAISSGLALNGSVLTLKGAGNLSLNGNLTQTGASQVVKTGTGSATLAGTNTYSGNTTISGGTLVAQNGNAILNTAGPVSAALGTTFQLLNNETVSSFVGAGDIGAGTNDSTLALGNNVLTSTSGVTIANVTTTATGGIVAATNIVDSDDDNNATGTGLFLQAGTGIGTVADPIETTITNFEAGTATGGVFISNTGALSIGGVSAALSGVDVTGASGAISVAATGSISVITQNEDIFGPGTITLNAQGASSDLTSSGSNAVSSIQSTGAGAAITLSAGRDVILGLPNPAGYGDTISAGSIAITAGRDFILQQDTFLDVNAAGTNTVNAGRDIILTNDASNSRLTTRGGAISLTATRNVVLNVLGFILNTVDSTQGGATPAGANVSITATTGNITIGDGLNAGTAGNVLLSAPAGSIIDTNLNTTSRILGNALTANSATGVTLETTVNSVTSATATGVGNIILRETDAVVLNTVTVANGSLTVNSGALTNAAAAAISVSGNANLTAPVITLGNQAGDSVNFGTFTFSTTSTVTLEENSGIDLLGTLTAPGAITLTAVDAAVAGQNITLPAGSSLTSTGGSILLNAGDDATFNGNLSASTTVTVNIDSGNADAGTGGTLVNTGTITAPGGATFSGSTDADTFTLAPQNAAAITVNGNAPFVAPGDVLNLDLTGTVNPVLSLGGPGNGSWSFDPPRQPVVYTSIEGVNVVGPTQYNLLLNANLLPWGNTNVDDQLTIGRTGTDLLVTRTGSNTVPDNDDVGPIFQGNMANILSFTYIGSNDNDVVTVSDAGGMLDFLAPVPSVPNNPNLAGQAEFLFTGGGGTDGLIYNFTGANAALSYAIGSGSGAAGNEGEVSSTSGAATLLTYFQSVESVQATGSGATPGVATIIGDLSANVVTVAAAGAATQVSVPGYSPFQFSGNNFSGLVINAGLGTDTLTMTSLGSGQTNPLATTLNGEAGIDTITLQSTSGNTGTVTLVGGAASDVFQLFNASNTVDNIVGPVIVDGTDGNVGGNTDTLTIIDSGDASADNVVISAVNPASSADYRIEGITTTPGNDVIIRNIDTLTYTGTQGNDTIDAQFVNTVPAHDLNVVTINGWLGADQFLLFTSDQAGGTSPTPSGVASGLSNITLNGDAPGNPNGADGNDVFGQTAPGIVGTGSGNAGLAVPDTVRGIRPSVSTTIAINGGEPTGPAAPTGDTVGDVLNLDLSGLPGASALVLPTVSGIVGVTGFQSLTYAQIEDLNLIMNNQLVNVQMGDTFVRGTAGQDLIQFMKNTTFGSDPAATRVRVNTLVVDFLLTGKTFTFAGASNDYVTQSNVTNPAEVYGEGGDDYISGGMANDLLVGGLGSDQINASGGDNVVWGDNSPTIPTDPAPQDAAVGGDDILSGLGGNDVFYGGGGNDSVSAGGGNDYIQGGQGNDTLGGAEGDDRIYGGLGNDVLGGGLGNDLLSAGGGDDQLAGNAGNDVLFAGAGADNMDGGGGNDLLVSGSVANENSSLTSVANTTTFNFLTYSNPADNDAALLTLLSQWGTSSNRSSIGVITHDAQDDDMSGGTGDDDFCWESFDILDELPAVNPGDFNSIGMGSDERFGPT